MRTEEKIRERISQYIDLQSRTTEGSYLYYEYDARIYILKWVLEE